MSPSQRIRPPTSYPKQSMATSTRQTVRNSVPRRKRLEPKERPLRALAAGVAQAARSAITEPFLLSVERQPIVLSRLPAAVDGMRIAHLSDRHHSPFTAAEPLERAIEWANG